MAAVQVTVSDLTAKVNAGWKKAALAAHYGLPMTQMTTLLQQAGLRIRKFHHPKFELIDDTNREVLSEQPAVVPAEDYAVGAAIPDSAPAETASSPYEEVAAVQAEAQVVEEAQEDSATW
jgi:hypothetical protein